MMKKESPNKNSSLLSKPIDVKTQMLTYLKQNLETEGYQIPEFMQYLGGKKCIFLEFEV